MTESKICRTVNVADVWATLIVSLSVLIPLLYFDVEASLHFIRKDASHQTWLAAMAMIFLICAQIACIYWIHLRNNVPRGLDLLERYLNRGMIIIGDLHYPSADMDQSCCSCFADSSVATVVYRHPMAQYKGCFVEKQVTVLDKYSRELETMLILPGEPYSAQPKADVQGMLAIGKARQEILSILEIYGLCYFLFTVISAAYVLFVRTWLDTNQDESIWIRYLGWIIFVVAVVTMPFVAFLISIIKWNRTFHWFKRGNCRFLQDDDDDYTHLTHLPAGVRNKTSDQKESNNKTGEEI